MPTYYEEIDGQQYDGELLKTAREAVEDPQDGRLSIADLTRLVTTARADGRGLTDVEVATLVYIRDNFNLTTAARRQFDRQLPEARGLGEPAPDAFSSYHDWVKEKLPERAALLMDAPDEAGVAAIEAALEKTLPAKFRAWYVAHPGERAAETFAGYLLGMRLLSPAEALGERRQQIDRVKEDELNDNWRGRVHPDRAIRKVEYNDLWLPLFTDDQGNFIGLDLDPDFRGDYGQLINFGADEKDHFVLARDLDALWTFLAERIEDDKMDEALFQDEDGNTLAYGLYPDSHLTDDMRYLLVE